MSEHLEFVLASYVLAGMILLLLIAWLLIDRHSTKRELDRLERLGIRRRSEEHKHER